MTHFTPGSARAHISDLAAEAVDAATDALESGRQFVTATGDKIGATARDLRESAADLARTSVRSASEAGVAAQRQLGKHAEATLGYVARKPWQSLAIAALVGAAAAALAAGVFRGPRDEG